MQTKQKLEKLYTNSEKIEEQVFVQRPSYEKNGLGFFLGKSVKKTIERNEPGTSEVKKDSHAWCDELEHIEGECKGKSFKHISNFYCHNCHGYGHYAVRNLNFIVVIQIVECLEILTM